MLPQGSTLSVAFHTDQPLGGDTGQATEITAGGVRGTSELGAKSGLLVPLTVSSTVSRDVTPRALPDVPLSTATPTPPNPPLDVPPIDPPSALAHTPSTIQLGVSPVVPFSAPAPALFLDPPLSSVLSNDSSHIQLAVSSTVPPSIPAHDSTSDPVWSATHQEDSPTVPSSIRLSEQRPGPSSLPGQPSEALWNFPPDYTPTFSSAGFVAAPSQALNDKSWGVHPGHDLGVGIDGGCTTMSRGMDVKALSGSHVSATDTWEPVGPLLSATDSDAHDDIEFDEDVNAVGRISAANLTILKDEFIEVQKRAKVVAEKTGLSSAQVLEHWSIAGARTHSKRNAWNLYNSYFRENEEEELSRLSERK